MNTFTLGKGKIGKLLVKALNIATKSVGSGHADITLTNEDMKSNIIFLAGTGDAGFNVIFNTVWTNFYVVCNQTSQTATLKNASGSTATLASGGIGIYFNDGTNINAITGSTGTTCTLAGVQTLTNKTLTSPAINTPTITDANGTVAFAERSFTETAGTGTYTATVSIPAGATVLGVIWDNSALWTNSGTAVLNVGDADDGDGYIIAVDVKTAPIADVNGAGGISTALSSTGTGAYKGLVKRYASTGTITATVVTSSTGGGAGRSRLFVKYALPTSVVVAVKA